MTLVLGSISLHPVQLCCASYVNARLPVQRNAQVNRITWPCILHTVILGNRLSVTAAHLPRYVAGQRDMTSTAGNIYSLCFTVKVRLSTLWQTVLHVHSFMKGFIRGLRCGVVIWFCTWHVSRILSLRVRLYLYHLSNIVYVYINFKVFSTVIFVFLLLLPL